MPYVITRTCKHPGCNNRSDGRTGFCVFHQQISREQTKARIAEAKRRKLQSDPTEAERRRFYSSKAWRNTRTLHLAREPLCRRCGQPAQMVDHIVRISVGGARLNSSNLQSLCHDCHNIKRSQEGRMNRYAQPTVCLIGPDMNQLREHVRHNARETDAMIDIHAIAETLKPLPDGSLTDAHVQFAGAAASAILTHAEQPSAVSTLWVIMQISNDTNVRQFQQLGASIRCIIPPIETLETTAKVHKCFEWYKCSYIPEVKEAYEQSKRPFETTKPTSNKKQNRG